MISSVEAQKFNRVEDDVDDGEDSKGFHMNENTRLCGSRVPAVTLLDDESHVRK